MSKHDQVSPMSFFSFQDIMACVTGIMILVCLILALDPLSNVPSSARVPGQSEQLRKDLDGARARAEETRKALEEATAALADAKARPQVTSDQLERLEKLIAKEREGLIAIERSREAASGDAQRQEDQTLLKQREIERGNEKVRAIKTDLAEKSLRARVQYQTGEREQLSPLLIEITPTATRVGELDAQGTPKLVATLATTSGDEVAAREAIGALLKAHPSSGWYVLLIVRDDGVTPSNALRDLVRGQGYQVGWQLWDTHDGGFFDLPSEARP